MGTTAEILRLEPDWARLRRAVNEFHAGVITIYPGGGEREELAEGKLVLWQNSAAIYSDGMPINVARSVTLCAPRGDITLYTAPGDGRHFHVTAASALLFHNVILDGQKSLGIGDSGGVEHTDGTLWLNGAVIRNCVRMGYGGAIHSSAALTLTDCEISGNTADNGGGVCVSGGGSLAMYSGAVSGNTASVYGGGVYADTAALAEESDAFRMTGGVIGENRAENGGGVYIREGRLAITNGTISENTARNSGGGVYVGIEGALRMTSGTIIGNIASALGGGVCLQSGSMSVANGTISWNTTSGSGGGVYVGHAGTLTMTGGLVKDNDAADGGGIFTSDYKNVSIPAGGAVTFRDNTANTARRMTHPADVATHNAQIRGMHTTSAPSPGGMAFTYLYNNYDVNYPSGDTADKPPASRVLLFRRRAAVAGASSILTFKKARSLLIRYFNTKRYSNCGGEKHEKAVY